jgi:hypothetical protein
MKRTNFRKRDGMDMNEKELQAIENRQKRSMAMGELAGLTAAQWELIRDDIPKLIAEVRAKSK